MGMTLVVTVPRPEAKDFNGDQRRAMLDWLDVQGIPNKGVLCVELLTVDVPIVAVTRKLRDDAGRCFVDQATGAIASETTDHLMRVPPPTFWQPAP